MVFYLNGSHHEEYRRGGVVVEGYFDGDTVKDSFEIEGTLKQIATTAATCHSIRFAFAGPSFIVQQQNKIRIKSQSQTLFASKGYTVSTVMTCLFEGKKKKNMKYIQDIYKIYIYLYIFIYI